MKRLFLIIATLLCLVACKQEPQVGRGGYDVILNVSETELHFYGTERSTKSFIIKSNYAWELSYPFDGDIESVSPMGRSRSYDPFTTIPDIIYVTVPAVVDSVEAGTKYYCGIIHIRAFDPTIPERTQRAEVTVYRHY